jgi:hypothetical protein
MRYMLLVRATPADWRALRGLPPRDQAVRAAFLQALERELLASGELVSAAELTGPEAACEVRAQGSDPPALAACFERELLARYWVIDCDDSRRALAVAARASAVPAQPAAVTVEVRPVMRAPGEEM